MKTLRSFASDNTSGVHPKVLAAMMKANEGSAQAYGTDDLTRKAAEQVQGLFSQNARAHFVFSGTGANVLGIASLVRSYESVFCASKAHLWCDETGAPEHFIGCKIIPLPSEDGKISPSQIEPYLRLQGDPHRSQPRAISLTQPTEKGVLYSTEEIAEFCDFAHRHSMYLHVDGARIANAAVALGIDFKGMITKTGVDVLSFGGTKNGLAFGEAVVFLNPKLGQDFAFLRKHGLQLASKMRFISAQYVEYLRDRLWQQNAAHANAMAKKLGEGLAKIPGVDLSHPVETNAVFARLPEMWIGKLQEEFYFYVWDPLISEVRLMTAFDTQEEDVEDFIESVRTLSRK